MSANVTLTELDYLRLMRATEQVAAYEAQAELTLSRLKARLAELTQAKDKCFADLLEKYPDLRGDVRYTSDDKTFTLYPNEA